MCDRTKELLKKLSLLSVTFAFCLIVAEIGLRLFTPQWLTHRMEELNPAENTPQFGSDTAWSIEKRDGKFYSFTPLSQFRVTHYEYNHLAHIDELGGRVTTSTRKAPTAIVPFLGDSFTFGVGVLDDGTYVSLLGAHSDKRLLNLGVPGSCLGQHLDIIRARHRELGSPSLYVFSFFVGNDYEDLMQYYRGRDNQRETDRAAHSVAWQINDFVYHNPILKRSYVLQLVKQDSLGIYNKWSGNTAQEPFFKIINRQNQRYRSEAEQALKRIFGELDQLSRELNFKPVFIIIPDRHQELRENLEWRARYYGLDVKALDADYPTRLLKRKLEESNISYWDLSACLSEQKQFYYIQDNHLTTLGHKKAAGCLSTIYKALN